MNNKYLTFANKDDLALLVCELCNCAKLGKNYLLSSSGKRTSINDVYEIIGNKSFSGELKIASIDDIAIEITIDFENHRIDASRYNEKYGAELSHQARSNVITKKGSISHNACANAYNRAARAIVMIGVVLFLRCLFATTVLNSDGTYLAPNLSDYGATECRFTSKDNNCVIVVPKMVSSIDVASFVGPHIRSGYSSDLARYYSYDYLISECGIRNVFFLGDRPSVKIDREEYEYWYVLSREGEVGSRAYDEFFGCTCWHVEGSQGWEQENFEGGVVRIGAALADIGVADGVVVSSDDVSCTYRERVSVELSCVNPNAIIRYTIDGTDPNLESAIYQGPIEVAGDLTVKAIAEVPSYPYAVICQKMFTRLWSVVETPIISADDTTFDSASQEISISCATDGAVVYYTIDGSEPCAANGRIYKGPFNVYDSVTVKAVAVKDGWKDSEMASTTFTKNNALSAAINMYNYLPDNDATFPWLVDDNVSHDDISSVRSGNVADNNSTTMKLAVRGAGRVSFWWKSSCEDAFDDEYYDYGSFSVGSDEIAKIAGITEWQKVVIEFNTTGKHILYWKYQKDDADNVGQDCIWVDQVKWIPADGSGYTLTTEIPVPYLWLMQYGLGVDTDFELAANAKDGKFHATGRPMFVWQDYVAGTDPTNPDDKLTASITFDENNKPIIGWSPELKDESGNYLRKYTVYGKSKLNDVTWTEVKDDAENYNFFKVTVEMP